MQVKQQASRSAKGEGKRIRRARNIVRRWEASRWNTKPATYGSESAGMVFQEIHAKRYERAVAILVRAALLGE